MVFKRVLSILSCYLFIFIGVFPTPIPSLVGDGVILLETSTGQVLYNKNGYEPFYPASTTKVLTSFILADHTDMTKVVTQTKESLDEVPSDSSSIGLLPGDSYTYYDGLHAILMRSDNFISHDMAVDYSGSIDTFANLMTDLSHLLGATSSFFANPHGYHDETHVTTPYDLARLTELAFSNKVVEEIASTPTYTFTNRTTGETMVFEHTAPFFNTSSPYYNPHIVAAKTGFHTPAGRTLVAKASYNNLNLIAVTMHSEYPAYFDDINTLVAYGTLNYALTNDANGVPFLKNISYADWAKFYIEQAITKGDYISTLENYHSSLTKEAFYELLSKVPLYSHEIAHILVRSSTLKQSHLPLSLSEAQTLLSDVAKIMGILLPSDFATSYLEAIYDTLPETLSLQDGIYLQQCLSFYLNHHSFHRGLIAHFTS